MNNQPIVISERIDDVVLLLRVMMQIGLPELRMATSPPSLASTRIGLGLGSCHLVILHPLWRRPPKSDGQRVGQPVTVHTPPEGKVRQNWTTFSSPGFGIANFSLLAGKTSLVIVNKLGFVLNKWLVLPRLSNFVQFHWSPHLPTRNQGFQQFCRGGSE
jgi:hypothetical protein